MDTLSAHVEFLLRTHDCVVMPGLGAFLCNSVAARFNADDSCIIPPGRRLVFNPLLDRNDGVLAASVSRKEGLGFEAASRSVAERIAHLRGELHRSGELRFGRLGIFSLSQDGLAIFTPDTLPGINGALYGLQPVQVQMLGQDCAADGISVSSCDIATIRRPRRWKTVRNYASALVAIVALAITVGIYFLSPIHVSSPTTEASLAPAAQMQPVAESIEVAEVPKDTIAAKAAKVTEVVANVPASEVTSAPAPAAAAEKQAAPADAIVAHPAEQATGLRFNDRDGFCVIVASFETRNQAEKYVAQNGSGQLGILEKEAKFRIYAATGASYSQATAQKRFVGNADAWVCRR